MALSYHSVFLLEDGTVKVVGNNSYGQLGLGHTTSQTTPQTVPNLINVKQVSCGQYYTVFLLENGTVMSVGRNNYGQLGLGHTTSQNTPQIIPDLSNVKQVACGGEHTIFLLNDGTVMSVGRNNTGQLGLGHNTSQNNPQLIPNLTNVKQVSCGQYYTVFLLEDGTVKVVGQNNTGQLGLGHTTNQTTPQLIPDLSNVKQVSCGQYHTVFLLEDGTVKVVGDNQYSQLGLGHTTNQNTPQLIPDLSNVKQVACGDYYIIFLLNNGTVMSVGRNNYGQLGLGNTTDQTTPQTASNLSNVRQVACGGNHTIFLLEDGTVKVVGLNGSGQLGLGNTNNQNTPQTASNLSNVIRLFSDFVLKIIIDRILIKLQNGELLSIDNQTLKYIQVLTEDSFIKYGMNKGYEIELNKIFTEKELISEDGISQKVDIIPTTIKEILSNNFQIIKYTEDIENKKFSEILLETEPYSVYDHISENPEVLVYTESTDDITVSTTVEPFELYEEFGSSVDVLYYTDDESVNEADLILEANWSPLDELEGDFEVVTWTDEDADTAQRVLEMTAVPKPKFIKLVNPLKLYGYLEDVLINDISQTYKNKKETRYLITDENSNDWYVFDKNTREFKIVDASTHESIIENGMTFEDLNSVEKDDWKKWGKEWLNIGVFLKDNERDTIVSVIDNMSYKDFLPRDTSSLSETSLYILNTTARIDISINGNTIEGVLSDDDLTRVQYRVLLNGKHYYPKDGSFTTLSESPQNIGITFTSKDIKVDELNTVRVEFRDFFGTVDYWEADFMGVYSGLIFKDVYGDYFSTEIGEVLKYLDFGVIVAGQVTVEHEIILKNQYGYDVKNIQLFANTSGFPDGMTIEFSESVSPFIPKDRLIITDTLKNNEELSFYVRLKTTLGVTPNANGNFDIIVRADRAD